MSTTTITADLCIVGAGSAGLYLAAGAARLGARTVLVERAAMGGECLNTGCVPSKALLAAAQLAADRRRSAPFGIRPAEPEVDFPAVMDHVRGVIEGIAPHDSAARFEGLGVTVLRGQACFLSGRELAVGDARIRARRFVVATGSRPVLPPIPGLADTPHLTNETLFASRVLPGHLIVIGGGPIGMEMAQAFRRLGSRVTVLEAARALSRDDPELAAVITARLRAEGVALREGVRIARIRPAGPGAGAGDEGQGGEGRAGAGVAVTLEDGEEIVGSHLLVAAGRAPVTDGLGLEAAGVTLGRNGIVTDARLRSANRRIFAIGDVTGRHLFTHMAAHQAGVALRNILFRLPARVETQAVPWVTYTDPELAQLGMSEAQARERYGAAIRVLRFAYGENDRARAERAEEGLIKAVVTPRGRLLGVGIAGRHAGELLQPWCLAMARGLRISDFARFIQPYPTLGEIATRLAGGFYAERLFSPPVRLLVRLLLRLP